MGAIKRWNGTKWEVITGASARDAIITEPHTYALSVDGGTTTTFVPFTVGLEPTESLVIDRVVCRSSSGTPTFAVRVNGVNQATGIPTSTGGTTTNITDIVLADGDDIDIVCTAGSWTGWISVTILMVRTVTAPTGSSGGGDVMAADVPQKVSVTRAHSNISLVVSGAWLSADSEGNAQVRPWDLVVPDVEAGDTITVFPDFVVGAASGAVLLTVAPVVNGAIVRHPFNNTLGVMQWSVLTGAIGHIQGPVSFVAQAGDIENGAVRLRIFHQTATATHTISAAGGWFANWSAVRHRRRPGTSLVFDGQSFNYAPLDGQKTLPQKVAEAFDSGVTYSVHGISGTTYPTRSTTDQDRMHPALVNGAVNTVLVDTGGQSDLLAGSSAATILTNMEAYHTAAKAAGATHTVMATIPSMTAAWGYTGPMETVRVSLNLLIKASSVWDAVADIAASPNSANPANTTYFPDGLHPSAPLIAEWAPIYAAAINAAVT